MKTSVEFRQGVAHAAQMFQGSLIDPVGALVIVENLEQSLAEKPPQYAAGILECTRRVRAELSGVKQ